MNNLKARFNKGLYILNFLSALFFLFFLNHLQETSLHSSSTDSTTVLQQWRWFNCHPESLTEIKAIKESRRIALKQDWLSATLITRLTCLEIGTTNRLAMKSSDFFFIRTSIQRNTDGSYCQQRQAGVLAARSRHIVVVQTPLSRHGIRDGAAALKLSIST